MLCQLCYFILIGWWECTWQGFAHNESFVFLVKSDVYLLKCKNITLIIFISCKISCNWSNGGWSKVGGTIYVGHVHVRNKQLRSPVAVLACKQSDYEPLVWCCC